MSLPSSQVWEIRTDTGLDTNGGGYDPVIGTSDYTYPTSSPISYTDLVIQATATNVSSAIRPFVAADVGNTLNVTGGTGFTVARYSVRSVAGGIATLDIACGTAASTGGAGKLGGALATLAIALSTTATSPTQGNTVWMRSNGTFHDLGGGVTMGFGNTVMGGAGFLLGYGTVRGDSGIPTLRQTLSLGTNNAITLSGNGYVLRGLIVDAQGTSGGSSSTVYSGNAYHKLERVKAINASGGGACLSTYTSTLYMCEVSGGFGQGILGNTQMYNCYIHDLPKQAVSLNQSGLMFRCIVANIGADAVGGDVPFMINCTVDNITGNGVKATNQASGISNWQMRGNIFSRCSGYGMLNSSGALVFAPTAMLDNNAFYSCTSGNRGNFGITYSNDVTLSAMPFVSAATGNYNINNAAGGGALLRGTSSLDTLGPTWSVPWNGFANAIDFGEYQHATPALGLTVTGTPPVLVWDADPRSTKYDVLGYLGAAYTVLIANTTATTYTDSSGAGYTSYSVVGVP